MSPWSSDSGVNTDPSNCGDNSSETLAFPVGNPSSSAADFLCSDSNVSLSSERDGANESSGPRSIGEVGQLTVAVSIAYGLLCVVGLAGNGLVVFVIARYASMKTVTNLYILNLSIADSVFLLGLPLLMTTLLARRWVFGLVLCKVYYVMTGVNAFTGSFTLTVMSADRYLAICHPITAISYRTPRHALLMIGALWAVSFMPMVPIILYAGLLEQFYGMERYTCTVDWPTQHVIAATHVYVIYNLVLGFLIPVGVICVFYGLLILRLRGARPAAQSAARTGRAARHPKVTRLVTLIIVVYIVCWLPYWAFQIHLITDHLAIANGYWKMYLYHVVTLLSYTNSMINPFLYAFTNHNFRESFAVALGCSCAPRRRRHGASAARAGNRLGYEITNLEDGPRGRKKDALRCQITGCSKTVTTEI